MSGADRDGDFLVTLSLEDHSTTRPGQMWEQAVLNLTFRTSARDYPRIPAPPGQTTVDEWHYADTRCASGARRAADFPHHHHAGFPKVIVKTRAGLVMVHVTTTLRLTPTHPFLKSSPTKSSLMSEGRRRQLVRASGGALQYGPDPVGGLADAACFSRMNRNSTFLCHQGEDSSPSCVEGRSH